MKIVIVSTFCHNIPDRQSYIKNIATLLAVCKEYGYRFSIDENEFFDFIDAIIKRFKDEESVVIVTASEKDLLTMVKEKLRVINKFAHNCIVYPAPKTAAARGLNRTLAACRTAPAPLI